MANRPAGSYGDWGISFRDAGNEIGTASGTAGVVFGDDDDSNIASQLTLFNTFLATIVALTLGSVEKAEYINTAESISTVPTNGAARELKLFTMYECTFTGKRYSLTIPTLNPTIPLYVQNASVKDAVRVDSPGTITAYIAAFNAFVKAPDVPFNVGTGLYLYDPAVTVIGLRVVGRNN